MTPSADLVEWLRWWEGLPGGLPALEAYADSAGVWTIGYGHTGEDVNIHQKISPQTADAMLYGDLLDRNGTIQDMVVVPIEQYRYDALTSFAFNLGAGALAGSSLLRYVNATLWDKAALEFPKWDHAGGMVNAGLLKRRVAEMHMFQSGDYSGRP